MSNAERKKGKINWSLRLECRRRSKKPMLQLLREYWSTGNVSRNRQRWWVETLRGQWRQSRFVRCLWKNRTRRVHTMLVRLYCLVMFEFVPTDFDLCQPSLCAYMTFSWDNCGNLLTKESAVYQIDWQWPLKFDPYILRSFGKYTSTYIYSYIL